MSTQHVEPCDPAAGYRAAGRAPIAGIACTTIRLQCPKHDGPLSDPPQARTPDCQGGSRGSGPFPLLCLPLHDLRDLFRDLVACATPPRRIGKESVIPNLSASVDVLADSP